MIKNEFSIKQAIERAEDATTQAKYYLEKIASNQPAADTHRQTADRFIDLSRTQIEIAHTLIDFARLNKEDQQ